MGPGGRGPAGAGREAGLVPAQQDRAVLSSSLRSLESLQGPQRGLAFPSHQTTGGFHQRESQERQREVRDERCFPVTQILDFKLRKYFAF